MFVWALADLTVRYLKPGESTSSWTWACSRTRIDPTLAAGSSTTADTAETVFRIQTFYHRKRLSAQLSRSTSNTVLYNYMRSVHKIGRWTLRDLAWFSATDGWSIRRKYSKWNIVASKNPPSHQNP